MLTNGLLGRYYIHNKQSENFWQEYNLNCVLATSSVTFVTHENRFRINKEFSLKKSEYKVLESC